MWRAFAVKHLYLSVPWASSTAVAEGENYAGFCTSKLDLKINTSSTCFAKFSAPEGRLLRAQSQIRCPKGGGRTKGRMLGPYGRSGHCSLQRLGALGAALARPSPRARADLVQSRHRANQALCWAPLAARGCPAGAEPQLHPAQPEPSWSCTQQRATSRATTTPI